MGAYAIILISFFLADLWLWRASARAAARLPGGRGWRLGVHAFFLLQAGGLALTVATEAAGLGTDAVLPPAFSLPLYLWHLAVLPLVFPLFAVRRAGRALARLVRRDPPPAPDPEGGVTRREFLAGVAALSPPLITLALSGVATRQLSRFRIRTIETAIPDLPPALEGAVIAHVADLHAGRFTHGRVLGAVAEAVNSLRADLVLFLGDLINDSIDWLPHGLEVLRRIDAPLVAIEGNHDLIDQPETFERTMKASGIPFLLNEAHRLTVRGEAVQLLGLRWCGPPILGPERHDEGPLREATQGLLRLRDPGAFPIFMAHHPHAWDYAGGLPLTLAGHTHGGQLMWNGHGFGPVFFRYWSGLYTRGAQALVVSNGVGNWYPIRTREAAAEVVRVVLRRAVTRRSET